MTHRAYVVRHAHAGARTLSSDDGERALSDRGEAQAEALVALLNVPTGTPVASSPARRCVQTLTPIARAAGVDAVIDARLAEGQGAAGLWELISETDIVVCTHGDVLSYFVDRLINENLIGFDEGRAEKASTWVVTMDGDRVVDARYLPPPLSER